MARPKNADSSVTFEAIQKAARSALQRGGVDGLTIRAVAKGAGVSIGTVRYYFSNKDALIEGCLDHYHERLVQLETTMIGRVVGAKNPREAIASGIRAVFDLLQAEPEMVRLRLVTTARMGEFPMSRRGRQRRPVVKNTINMLKLLPGLRPQNLQLTIDAMVRLITSYAACSEDEIRDIVGDQDPVVGRAQLREYSVALCLRMLFDDEP